MISLRLMEDTLADYKALQSWFHEPELQEFVWCDEKGESPVRLERIIEKYGERVKHPKDVFPYFILLDGEAIGFVQYDMQDAATVGLDMWIGRVKDRSRGYGSEALRQMVEIIHRKHPQVKTLLIDPEVANGRAIRCYEKAGFVPEDMFLDEEGALCMMMKICFE